MNTPVLFAGDPHGDFEPVIRAAEITQASAVILLGDLEPRRPLHQELTPLLVKGIPVWFIHGNHDSDSDDIWRRVWDDELADRNIDGRVIELPDGRRLAGLGGVFRGSVWFPKSSELAGDRPKFPTRQEHARATPRQDRWRGGTHRRHWGTIYPEAIDRLATQSADILVLHEAPSYHPCGFVVLDELARGMKAKVVVHGHHHDALDSSSVWVQQGFRSYGVGLRGVSGLWPDGRWEVIVPGELDGDASHVSRTAR
ncbi:metallophosphoesterase [Paucibacter sp. R3-3]|uniref:Metallophosphoesterase n=1 Tax=Roseateles agri TaxID=3098619 RepID=A0ABU5DQY0_9BURK|nr:metallophosphoesterase [Paucibacter sp. R3-3]MDY0748730.1 metallophosphoesterase [Paucibacter sp. R3-3]